MSVAVTPCAVDQCASIIVVTICRRFHLLDGCTMVGFQHSPSRDVAQKTMLASTRWVGLRVDLRAAPHGFSCSPWTKITTVCMLGINLIEWCPSGYIMVKRLWEMASSTSNEKSQWAFSHFPRSNCLLSDLWEWEVVAAVGDVAFESIESATVARGPLLSIPHLRCHTSW